MRNPWVGMSFYYTMVGEKKMGFFVLDINITEIAIIEGLKVLGGLFSIHDGRLDSHTFIYPKYFQWFTPCSLDIMSGTGLKKCFIDPSPVCWSIWSQLFGLLDPDFTDFTFLDL